MWAASPVQHADRYGLARDARQAKHIQDQLQVGRGLSLEGGGVLNLAHRFEDVLGWIGCLVAVQSKHLCRAAVPTDKHRPTARATLVRYDVVHKTCRCP